MAGGKVAILKSVGKCDRGARQNQAERKVLEGRSLGGTGVGGRCALRGELGFQVSSVAR